MNEAILRINSISIYGFGLLAVVSFLWGSFVFFRKSSESNFDDKTVLDSVVLSAFWGLIVGRLTFSVINIGTFWNHWSRLLLLSNFPGIERFGVIAGVAFGLWLCLRKGKGRFLDWFDLMTLGISAGTAVFIAGLAIFAFKWQFIFLALVYLFLFIFYWSIEDKYRTFDWYKNKRSSARSGLITGFSISSWGVMYAIEKILTSSFVWQAGVWSGLLLVGGLVLVYIRSGRTATTDIKVILRHGKK